jgi:hypothetical protein
MRDFARRNSPDRIAGSPALRLRRLESMRTMIFSPLAVASILFACSPLDDDAEAEPMNVCTYEVATCYDETCPPGDDAYSQFCVDTTLGSCNISTEVTSEYVAEAEATFYTYTRNVRWMGDITCADVQ